MTNPDLRRSGGRLFSLLVAVLLVGMLAPQVVKAQSTPPIRPQASSLQEAGSAFWIEVEVGSDRASVEDLFGASLTMTYDTSRVNVLEDEAGPFLGGDVVYSSNVDKSTGEVGIGVSRKSGDGGVEGAGVVARVKVQVESDVPEGDTLSFGLPDVDANDSDGNPIALDPASRDVTVGTAVPMRSAIQVLSGEADGTPAPGDTIAVDVTLGSSAIPVSDLFGTSFTWTYDPSRVSVLSDTAGAFLGADLVYSSNLDATNGELGIGVSQKAGANGADGGGSVARVVARVDPDVTEGTTLTFGLTNAQATNPADSSIVLDTVDGVITANATPAPPDSLDGTASGRSVALTWAAPSESDLQRYRIYRDTAPIDSSGGPAGLTPLDSTTADTTGFVDSTGAPGTTYYYRLTAVDSLGSESGFSNEAQAEPTAVPIARSDSASSITDTSATLYGTVDPGGTPTEVRFRYYPIGNPAAADTITAAESPLGSATDEVVTAPINGLNPGTEYAFATLAENSVGRTEADPRTFSTLAVGLAVAKDTSRVGAVQMGESSRSFEVAFQNEGTVPLTNLQIFLEGPAAGDYQIIEDSGEERLSAGETRTLSVTFAPSASGVRAALLRATSAEGSGDTTRVLGRGVKVGVEAGTAARGAATTLSVNVEGGFKARTERSLFARKSGTQGYRAVPFDAVDSSETRLELEGTVPPALIATQGVDYYGVLVGNARLGDRSQLDTVTVPAGGLETARRRPGHLPVAFDSLAAPVPIQPRAYRMMTISAVPESGIKTALRQRYGRYDRTEWRVLRWAPDKGANGGYREYPSIDSLRPGAGFWLITASGDPLRLGPGRTTDAASARRVPVKAGWNQVGSPFQYAVPWDTVRAASGLDPDQVDGPVGYVNNEYQYERARLEPWTGGFVRVPEADTLVVPPVAAATQQGESSAAEKGPIALNGSALSGSSGADFSGGPSSRTSSSSRRPDGTGDRVDRNVHRKTELAETTEPRTDSSNLVSGTAFSEEGASVAESPYTLRIEAQGTDLASRRVWLGLRPNAQAGRDKLDFAQAPPIKPSIRLSVREEIAGAAVPHAGSFKPPPRTASSSPEAGRSWTLTLANRSETDREVRLAINSEGRLPDGLRRYVMDLSTEHRITSGATLSLEGGSERRLKVIVGTEAFARRESEGIGLDDFTTDLRKNYPNPFEQTTTLAYTLSDERDVTIEIYDVLGRRIRTLVRAKPQEPGRHRIQWRGQTRYGDPAGSGVYFYRIEAGDFTETRKMVLVR